MEGRVHGRVLWRYLDWGGSVQSIHITHLLGGVDRFHLFVFVHVFMRKHVLACGAVAAETSTAQVLARSQPRSKIRRARSSWTLGRAPRW